MKLSKENAKLKGTVANQANEIRALRDECAALQSGHRDARGRGRDVKGAAATIQEYGRPENDTAALGSKPKAIRSIPHDVRGQVVHEPHELRTSGALSEESLPAAEQQARRLVLGKRIPNIDSRRREPDLDGHTSKSARYHFDDSKNVMRRAKGLQGTFSSRNFQNGDISPSSKYTRAEGSSYLAPMDGPRKSEKLAFGPVARDTIRRRDAGLGVRADEVSNPRLTRVVGNGRDRENFGAQPSKSIKRSAPVIAAPWEYGPAGKGSAAPSALSRFASSARSTPVPPSMARRATLPPSTGAVPRPSATPDRFSRPARHPRPAYNPLSAQK
jgi:hypothetical protein